MKILKAIFLSMAIATSSFAHSSLYINGAIQGGGGGSFTGNASDVTVPFTATNYTPPTTDVEGHFIGVDSALGSVAGAFTGTASNIEVPFAPTNYTPVSTNIDGHFIGVDSALGSVSGGSGGIAQYIPTNGGTDIAWNNYTAGSNQWEIARWTHDGKKIFNGADPTNWTPQQGGIPYPDDMNQFQMWHTNSFTPEFESLQGYMYLKLEGTKSPVGFVLQEGDTDRWKIQMDVLDNNMFIKLGGTATSTDNRIMDFDDATGNIGIKITNSLHALHVGGSMQVSGSMLVEGAITNTGALVVQGGLDVSGGVMDFNGVTLTNLNTMVFSNAPVFMGKVFYETNGIMDFLWQQDFGLSNQYLYGAQLFFSNQSYLVTLDGSTNYHYIQMGSGLPVGAP